MLKPSKHLDLDRSAVRVASEMLAELRRRRIVPYESIIQLVRRRTGDDGDAVVAPALSLLYTLGCIEYHAKNDTLEYIQPLEE